MFHLEKYHGSSSRYDCPNCGRTKTFVRYIDESGTYLATHVGRCNRESKCRYHYPPRQYFAESGSVSRERIASTTLPTSAAQSYSTSPISRNPHAPRKPDLIATGYLLETLTNYEDNSFVRFLLRLFPNDRVERAVARYVIGTLDGYTVFPKIDKNLVVRSAKLMKFDPRTGKRLKHEFSISSLQAKLKRRGKLRFDFETDKSVFFGEHMLASRSELPLAIVESEKSAVIASMCKGVFPEMIWLASGSKQSLKPGRLERIGGNRTVLLYPDADAYAEWREVASIVKRHGMSVKVSTLIEEGSIPSEKECGADIADYLIAARTQSPSSNN